MIRSIGSYSRRLLHIPHGKVLGIRGEVQWGKGSKPFFKAKTANFFVPPNLGSSTKQSRSG